jgi:hypothetical protein
MISLVSGSLIPQIGFERRNKVKLSSLGRNGVRSWAVDVSIRDRAVAVKNGILDLILYSS